MSRSEIPIAPANGAPGPVFGRAPAEDEVSVTSGELLFGGLPSSVVEISVVGAPDEDDGGALEEVGDEITVLGDADPVVCVSVGTVKTQSFS